MISYDLKLPGRNYPGIISEIKSFGESIRPLESFWLVKTSYSAQQMATKLYSLDITDKVFIAPIANNIDSFVIGLSQEAVIWIKNRM